MEMLDGNAAAGSLVEAFGAEMTTAVATCAGCGATAFVGEVAVYQRAPGTVLRCPSCASILAVLVERRGVYCVDLSGVRELT
jgi:Family of unknown function (DUF6510)